MTSTTLPARARTTAQDVTALARLCLWAGLVGGASGIALAVVPAAVDSDRYSYPLSAAAFVVAQCWFAVQHLGLLAGLVALGRSGWPGGRRRGVQAACVGMGLLTAMELLAITAVRSSYPTTATTVLDAGYGIASTMIGVGLVAAGVATLRAGVAHGRRRWVPLVLGAYVFVPMFPAMAAGFVPARLAIAGWMLLFALLGLLLADERRP